MTRLKTLRNVIEDVPPILSRNVFTLINGLIVSLSLLLWLFGDARDALFVASVVTLNSLVGIMQELRARFALERLQALAIVQVMRIGPEGEHLVDVDRLRVGDHIRVQLGDQIPSDAKVLISQSLEVNEALLTGETLNIPKNDHDELLGGSYVVAGSATLEILRSPAESYIGRMTEKIKRYHFEQSPIQKDLTRFIRIMTYVLLVLAFFIVLRGVSVRGNTPDIIKQIAALAGFIVPEGLLLAATMLFAYGAVQMLRRRVLLQQINATEKLGRIEVLCVDKTGTLTENTPVFDRVVLVNDVTRADFDRSLRAYMSSDGANTQTILALRDYTDETKTNYHVIDSVAFSSSRKFGAVRTQRAAHQETIFVGAPDILLPAAQKQSWIRNMIEQYARDGKRLILVAKTEAPVDMKRFEPNASRPILKPLGVVVLTNPLKKGTAEIIDFFQKRNVSIKLISGDNAVTVSAVAREAGIVTVESEVVTGDQIASWSDEDFAANVDRIQLFARVLPEQKEQIVMALQQHSIVAMIGDGANDAMAIKRADLGIAMFEGSSAARQVADIVLMNNSFADLPRGVRLSDSIITTIELVAGLFFNKVVVGILLFLGLLLAGQTFDLVPRNLTIINYFIVGFPVVLWSLWPRTRRHKPGGETLFAASWPFALLNGTCTALGTFVAYLVSQRFFGADRFSARMVLIVCLLSLGVGAILLVPVALHTRVNRSQNRLLMLYAAFVALLFSAFTSFPSTARFFALVPISFQLIGLTVGIVATTLILQYAGARFLAQRVKVV